MIPGVQAQSWFSNGFSLPAAAILDPFSHLHLQLILKQSKAGGWRPLTWQYPGPARTWAGRLGLWHSPSLQLTYQFLRLRNSSSLSRNSHRPRDELSGNAGALLVAGQAGQPTNPQLHTLPLACQGDQPVSKSTVETLCLPLTPTLLWALWPVPASLLPRTDSWELC